MNILKFRPRESLPYPELNKRFKTTKGYVAQIIEHRLTGEFFAKANIYNKLLKYEGMAYYNAKGEVQGMLSFYGNLRGGI